MLSALNRDAFLLMNQGGNLTAYEFTGHQDEILASKSTAWLGSVLNNSPIFDVKGPQAAEFLNSICVNNFSQMDTRSIRHGIICNEKGQILTDGVVMKIADDTFRTYWLSPVIDYYASVSDMVIEYENISGQEFFFQLSGPKSLEILEQASKSNLHDIQFVKHRVAQIAGVDVRILRLGMAGTLAYEMHGDMADADKVYEAIWEVAETYGAKKLGQVAYCMNHTEAGFPNINTHYPLPWFESDPGLAAFLADRPMQSFFNLNRKLVGSVGDDLDARFVTPYDVGWEGLIKFDYEFMGKQALEEMGKNPKRTLVTLEWDPDDVGDIYASQLRGRKVKPYASMEGRPAELYYNGDKGCFHYHADQIMDSDKVIGISVGRLHSYYYRRMISLGFIEKDYAQEGSRFTVVWGSPGKPQKKVRVKVVRTPYMDLENNSEIDVDSIPHFES